MKPVHLSIVLDRSGSMAAIADDVVGGVNEFVERQRTGEGDARLTLVQFDSQDPFEVIFDGVEIGSVPSLTRSTYVPRGSTPLLDAVGRMIASIDANIAARAEQSLPEEDQVVLIVTDGLENASREQTLSSVLGMVEDRRAKGWVFTFLGADQDSFREGGKLGVAAANRVNWAKTKAGSKKMWSDLAHSSLKYRDTEDALRMAEADRFHQEAPEAD